MNYIQNYDQQGRFIGVIRDDGAAIPPVLDNRDWQIFLAWNAQQVSPLSLANTSPQPKIRTINDLAVAIFSLTGSFPTPAAGTQKANIIANLFAGTQGNQLWQTNSNNNKNFMAAIATSVMNNVGQYIFNAPQQMIITAMYVQDNPTYLINPSFDPTINVTGYTS